MPAFFLCVVFPCRWYNFLVPTPFYHLSIAVDLLKSSHLSGWARRCLNRQRCAFLLGNTAPDVQVISGQPRKDTHFFGLPIDETAPPPWELLLSTHFSLSNPHSLPPNHTAFLAGYLCHLLADWLWIRQIYSPVFGPECAWESFPQRLYLHNVLRAYLDRQVLASLPDGLGTCLEAISPQDWLPFVEDRHLRQWRDFLSGQLHPGAIIQTVEVFAQRAGISSADFHRLLNSPERMQAEVFNRMPLADLSAYRQEVFAWSIHLIHTYLGRLEPSLDGAHPPAQKCITNRHINQPGRPESRI
jgi:hypothetical protein